MIYKQNIRQSNSIMHFSSIYKMCFNYSRMYTIAANTCTVTHNCMIGSQKACY